MTKIDWQPLPPLCPSPAVWTDAGDFMLLVFTEDNVPTWEVRRKAAKAATIWSLARRRQRRCPSRRPGAQNDDTV